MPDADKVFSAFHLVDQGEEVRSDPEREIDRQIEDVLQEHGGGFEHAAADDEHRGEKQLIGDDVPRLVDDEQRQDAQENHDRDSRAARVVIAAEQHARRHDGREGQIHREPDVPELFLLAEARKEE